MKKLGWQFWLGIILIILSAFFYFIHFLIFHDSHHIFIYLFGDIAFVFIEVLLVTLIIHKILEYNEKKHRLEKLNMVIGAFFSEAGSPLLQILSKLDPKSKHLQQSLSNNSKNSDNEFGLMKKWLYKHSFQLDESIDFQQLKVLLVSKREFLLRLLENPNILEHESFTDLLWAVFHMTEELIAREKLDNTSTEDFQHLKNDLIRVYTFLAPQWLKYMEHLKISYPYLFSLALRTNPFNKNASAAINPT